MKKNRREFFKTTGITSIILSGTGNVTVYGSEFLSGSTANKELEFEPYNRFPRMVQEYFVEKVRRAEQDIIKQQSFIKTKSDAETYIKDVRFRIQECFGPWPDKTPLNPRITGIITREGYVIEKVIFESRPGFQVTANLYIPRGRKFPLPGVIGTCGHSGAGKGDSTYQSYAQGLVKLGYVVLIFDPPGQGERVQYLTEDLKSRLGASGVLEHYQMGNQMVLTGEKLSSWFAWDGIRALDYLLTRKEVDPKHIGVTGNSGGGTQTTWLCAVEPRFTMAAPSCFLSTYRRTMENEHPADPEQCPPKVLGMKLDHSDFIAAMAPKPVILLGQEKDFFDSRGLKETFARLKHLYSLLEAEQNIALHIGPDYHGYYKDNREAMYRWFNQVTKISNMSEEPPVTPEKNDVLLCTQKGQVNVSGSRPVFSFIAEKSVSLKKQRQILSGNELKKAVISVLKLSSPDSLPDYRVLYGNARTDRYYPKRYSGQYAVETEPGIFSLLFRLSDEELFSPIPEGIKRALLYVSHKSADEELRNEPFIKDLMASEPEAAVFACDLRGIGDSLPQKSDYFYATFSNMLDISPFVGQKTFDLLSIINLLKSCGHEQIHLAGKGQGAIPATFAALLSESVSTVTLKNSLTSYSDITENEDYNWPLSSFVPGILKTFDLPDCYRELGSKNLKQIDPWNEKEE